MILTNMGFSTGILQHIKAVLRSTEDQMTVETAYFDGSGELIVLINKTSRMILIIQILVIATRIEVLLAADELLFNVV